MVLKVIINFLIIEGGCVAEKNEMMISKNKLNILNKNFVKNSDFFPLKVM